MGMYTTVILRDGTELQFKCGYDDCETYKVGDAVNWYADKRNPGEGKLFDGVYPTESYTADWKVLAHYFVIIKDHLVHSIVQYNPEDEDSMAAIYTRYNTDPYEHKWWTEEQWKTKEEQDAEHARLRAIEDAEFEKETAGYTQEQKFAAIFSRPLRRTLDYQGIAQKFLTVTPLTEADINPPIKDSLAYHGWSKALILPNKD